MILDAKSAYIVKIIFAAATLIAAIAGVIMTISSKPKIVKK